MNENLVVLEENTQVEILEDYINLDEEKAFNLNHFSEYFLAENAQLKVNI